MANTKIWRDTIAARPCSSAKCRKRIHWAVIVKSGRWMPFDVDPEEARLFVEEEVATKREMLTVDLKHNHFGTCPGRADFERSGRGGRR